MSLAEYVERMKDGQDAIYYISGEDMETVIRSPQLEGFRKRGVEVLANRRKEGFDPKAHEMLFGATQYQRR